MNFFFLNNPTAIGAEKKKQNLSLRLEEHYDVVAQLHFIIKDRDY